MADASISGPTIDSATSTSDPLAPGVKPFQLSEWVCVAYLVFVFGIAFRGFQHAGIYVGDVCAVLADAHGQYLRGVWSSNPYIDAHILLFHLLHLPLNVHLALSLLTSAVTAVGLYFILRAMPGLSETGRSAAVGLWIANNLCSPPEQIALSNLFAYALVLPALAWILARFTWTRWLWLLASVWLAAHCRPEYYAVLLAVGVIGALQGVWLWLARRAEAAAATVNAVTDAAASADAAAEARERDGLPPPPNWATAVAAVGFALVIAVVAAIDARQPADRAGSADSYLLLGFSQSYAFEYRNEHPEESVNPWFEHVPLTNKAFGNPEGLSDVVLNAPGKFVAYLWRNTLRNARHVLPSLLISRAPPVIVYDATLVGWRLFGTTLAGLWAVGMLVALMIRRRNGTLNGRAFLRWLVSYRVLMLAALSFSGILPVMMYTPEQRLYVGLVPVVYLGFAWSLSTCLAGRSRRWHWAVLVAVLSLFVHGVYIRAWSNRGLVMDIAKAAKDYDHPPYIGGPEGPIAAAACGSHMVADSQISAAMLSRLANGQYDLFLFSNALLNSTFYRENKDALDNFRNSPEDWGYEHVNETNIPTGWYLLSRRVPDKPTLRDTFEAASRRPEGSGSAVPDAPTQDVPTAP